MVLLFTLELRFCNKAQGREEERRAERDEMAWTGLSSWQYVQPRGTLGFPRTIMCEEASVGHWKPMSATLAGHMANLNICHLVHQKYPKRNVFL